MAGCAAPSPTPALDAMPPIVFVHGNGDSAALWQTTIWRFESNGWPRERLHAIDLPYPLARDDDAQAQPGRSSTAEHMAFLRQAVEQVRQASGASRVVLIGSSRGGNAIRNYLQHGGGERTVSHALLGGTPNHGIWALPGYREGNEFSGTGPFLAGLNTPKAADGRETVPGVQWLTLRSDRNDKYAQPTGEWIGLPGKPTRVNFDSPALKGATNVVLPGADHRETAFSPAAFAAMWEFLTGRAPTTREAVPEAVPRLEGLVSGLGLRSEDPASGDFANNLPLSGAQVQVFATDPTTGLRQGPPVHQSVTTADGRWGPFMARSDTAYEFVLAAPGYATTHIYRSPLPRGSRYLHLRPERLASADRSAGAVVVFSRPRGYFDAQRDTLELDGSRKLPGVPAQGAGVSSSKLRLPLDLQRAVAGSFNGERITGLSWPAREGHLTVLELSN